MCRLVYASFAVFTIKGRIVHRRLIKVARTFSVVGCFNPGVDWWRIWRDVVDAVVSNLVTLINKFSRISSISVIPQTVYFTVDVTWLHDLDVDLFTYHKEYDSTNFELLWPVDWRQSRKSTKRRQIGDNLYEYSWATWWSSH